MILCVARFCTVTTHTWYAYIHIGKTNLKKKRKQVYMLNSRNNMCILPGEEVIICTCTYTYIQELKEFRNMCQISLELALKVVISCHMGAGNQTWILYKSGVSF